MLLEFHASTYACFLLACGGIYLLHILNWGWWRLRGAIQACQECDWPGGVSGGLQVIPSPHLMDSISCSPAAAASPLPTAAALPPASPCLGPAAIPLPPLALPPAGAAAPAAALTTSGAFTAAACCPDGEGSAPAHDRHPSSAFDQRWCAVGTTLGMLPLIALLRIICVSMAPASTEHSMNHLHHLADMCCLCDSLFSCVC